MKYSFSIPSIHDQTPLDCRIYYPKSLAQRQHDDRSCTPLRTAIVAHPYGPLGGSYDDTVVLEVTKQLRREGFIVGTFNFRGAGGSSGSTSLTGKAEQADYESFVGFVIRYCQHLMSTLGRGDEDNNQEKGDQTLTALKSPGRIHMLLAGYSYGSLVLARLQSISTIAKRFQQPTADTTEADIVNCARRLGLETKGDIERLAASSEPIHSEEDATSHGQRSVVSSVTMGAEQSHPQKKHRHFRKSTEAKSHARDEISGPSEPNEPGFAFDISARYLLISPVILPFTHSICPPGSPSIMLSLGRATAASNNRSSFLDHPTLAVFGDKDGFTSSSRLRAWAEKQSQESRSSFEWAEIVEAGHFWREEGAMEALQEKVASWSKTLPA